MASPHEQFWTHESYAFVGRSDAKPFPQLSYEEARKQGRKVFAVDPSAQTILGDKTYPDLESLPEKVEAVVLEVPKEETASWVERAADAGVEHVWIHMGRDTPDALTVAKERGVEALTGRCAVMYVKQGFSLHSIHRWAVKLGGKY